MSWTKALIHMHEDLFDGQLGLWKGDPVDIPLNNNSLIILIRHPV